MKMMHNTSADMTIEKKCKKLIELFKEANIDLYFDNKEKRILLDKYKIYYSSKLSAIQTLEEVFLNMAYYFHIDKDNPFIIDAGSEVGMATIFFKMFYPNSNILCFEAHPYSFELLQKNIKVNEFNNVTVVNMALTNKEGEIDFFGEFNLEADDVDTRGSSVIREWGLQRSTSSLIKVNAVKLSQYIKHEVDYLKLNIEGAEQQVLEDLETEDKMKFIDRLLIKFHHSSQTKNVNNLDYSLWLLSKNQFAIKRRTLKKPELVFDIAKGWAADHDVCLHTLFAKKENDAIKQSEQSDSTPNELQKNFYLLRKSFLEKECYLLRNVVDNIPSSIYWKDKDGYYLGHSAYAVHQLRNTNLAPNATINNIIGKSDYDIFTKEVADKYRKNDLYIMENKKNLILEETIMIPEGGELIQLSSKSPLYDEKMEVVGVIGSTVDITDRRKAELLQKEKEVNEKITRAIEMLSGSIAHEVKNPLASISMYVDNLQLELKNLLNGTDKTEQKKHIVDFIKKIKVTIYNASSIVNMLLIKLRSILGKTDQDCKNFQSISIVSCINEVEKEYPFLEGERELLIWNDAGIDFNYMGNQLLTKHVLFNLVKNALKTIKDAEKGKMYINLQMGKEFNYLIFKDTASGISDKKLESIFQQFGSKNSEGTGLGLPFCKITMQSYGGDIVCDSKGGEYTEFTLSFKNIA